jgi:hypothetical protein
VGEVVDTDAEGWLTVKVGFDVEEIACEYALGFGANLEVLETVIAERESDSDGQGGDRVLCWEEPGLRS